MKDCKLNILIVDDEQIILDSINRHLRKVACKLFFALSVNEGMKIINENKIDLILTDLMMPEIDGLEFMKMVKESNPQIPMIMITGYATINTALQATQLGAFDYIAKPFSKKELMSVLEKAADIVQDSSGENNSKGISGDLISSSGDYSWMLLDDDGVVVLGIKKSFIKVVGQIRSIYLPAVGDEVRQGGSFLQVVAVDKKPHSVISPLTGTIVAINEELNSNPNLAADDPYEEGWIVKIKPSRLDDELKYLGY